MDKQIFRKESMESVTSPEQLNEYIRVSTPSMWVVLVAVAVLLIGVCVWGTTGRIDVTVQTVAIGENDTMRIYIREADIESVKEGMTVAVDEVKSYAITEISMAPDMADENIEEYALHIGEIKQGEWIYSAVLSGPYDEGIHSAKIIVESVSPMSFVMN